MGKFILALLCVLLANSAYAKDLYVSTTGADSVSYAANDVNNPWLTIEHTWGNALPGDTAYYKTGTYTITAPYSSTGDASNVYHTNFEDDVVTWSTNQTREAIQVNVDNITIDGININAGTINTAESGYFRLGQTGSSTHFTLNDSVATIGSCSDNCGVIHAKTQAANYLTVTNCKITGQGNTSGSANSAGIWVDYALYVTIENNEFSNTQTGVLYKHANERIVDSGPVIKNNYFKGHGYAGLMTASSYSKISNNIFDSCEIVTGLNGGEGAGGTGSDFNVWEHNTFAHGDFRLSTASGTDPGATYNTVTNNIIVGRARYHPWSTGYVVAHVAPDYNLYGDTIQENSVTYSLAEWQTHILANLSNYGDDDSNSIVGSPTFLGGANPTTIAGFALTAASDGYKALPDDSDIGADVRMVGVNIVDAGSGKAYTGVSGKMWTTLGGRVYISSD